MPLHPATQQWIGKVEELSCRLVHVTEDPVLDLMVTIRTARGIAPAHFLRYRPGTRAVDYLVAYQLGYLVWLFSCPVEERWRIVGRGIVSKKGRAPRITRIFGRELRTIGTSSFWQIRVHS